MRISVGSKNKNKVDAVKELMPDYDFLSDSKVTSIEVSSDFNGQPKTLDETVQGAINRAKKAFKDCDLSFGIEDGLMNVSETKSGYMNVCVCAIFDGKQIHLGTSSGFEYPVSVTKLVFDEGIEIDEAMFKAGVTKNKRIGYSDGVIGLMTKGRLNRKDYTKQAIVSALIHLENSEVY